MSATEDDGSEPGFDVPAPGRPPWLPSLMVAVALAALGAPLGWLWAAIAPGVPMVKADDGARLVESQPEEFIAADGWFTLLGLGLGIVAAVVVWLALRPHRGPVMLIGLAVGAVGTGLIAWWLGAEVALAGWDETVASAPVGAELSRPPDLRAGGFEWLYGVIPTLRGDVLMPAFGAVVAYTLLAGWSRYPNLRHDDPEPMTPAPPAPEAPEAPAPPAP